MDNLEIEKHLEELPIAIQNAGEEWGKASKNWKQLEDLTSERCKNELATIKLNLAPYNEDGKIKSDAQLERESRAGERYKKFTEENHEALGIARGEEIRCHAVYESTMAKYELVRSMISRSTAMLKERIYSVGKA
ncbi:MAG: hypothetical protein V3U02_04415 [Calditrichia bacterium]